MKIKNTLHKHSTTKLKIFLLLLLCSFGLDAQVTWNSAPKNGLVGSEYTYSINQNGTSVVQYTWSVSTGGQIVANSQTPTSVKVKWTSSGTRQVLYTYQTTSGGDVELSVSVNVTTGGPTPPDPPTIASVNTANCDVVISRDNPSDGSTWYWQGTNPNGISQDPANNTPTYEPSSSGTYYIRAVLNNVWSTSTPIPVTIPSPPSRPSVSGNLERDICPNQATTMSISGASSNLTYKWYKDSTYLGGDGTSKTVSPSSSAVYSVTATNSNGCESLARAITVNVLNLPQPIANNEDSNCANSSVVLSVFNTKTVNGVVRNDMTHVWYRNSNGTNPITAQPVSGTPNGTLATQVNVTGPTNTSYWVASKLDGCESELTRVDATFQNIPLQPGSINTTTQTICYNKDPNNIASVSAATGGDDTYVYSWWYSSTQSGDYIEINNSNFESYNPNTNLTSDRWYKRKVESCNNEAYTASVRIDVKPALTGGSIQAPSAVCFNGNPNSISSTSGASNGIGGYTYQWFWSNSQNGTYNAIANSNVESYNPSNLTSSRWYQRKVTSCNQNAYSNKIQIVVAPQLSAPTGSTNYSVCGNANVTLTLTPDSDATEVRWYTSSTGGTYLGSGSINEGVGTYYASSYYSANGINCSSSRTPVTVSALNNLNPGSINDISQTVCYDGNPTSITNASAPSGGGTKLYRWQYKNVETSNWVYIGSATTNTSALNFDPPGGLQNTRTYRREVESCGNKLYSNEVTITVVPQLSAPSGITNYSVCGSANVTLTMTPDSDATEVRWYTSMSGGDYLGNGSISKSVGTYYASSYYNANCESARTPVTVSPLNNLDPGSINNVSETICYDGNPAMITSTTDPIGGETNTYQWQYKDAGTSNWVYIGSATSNTSALNYDPPAGLQNTRTYRREVESCGDKLYSNEVTVTVIPQLAEPTFDTDEILFCGSGTVPINITNDDSTVTGRWYSQAVGGPYFFEGTTYNAPAQNATYYVSFRSDDLTTCESGTRKAVTVTLSGDITWSLDADDDNYAFEKQQSCDSPGAGWKAEDLPLGDCDDNNPNVTLPKIWYADLDENGQGDGLGDPNSPSELLCVAPTGYVGNSDDLCPDVSSATNECFELPTLNCTTSGSTPVALNFTGDNYIYSRTYQTERANSTNFFSQDENLIQEITYFDGLGRPIQQVGIDQAPNKDDLNNYGDIITHIEYDSYGRMVKEFLPYATTEGNLGTFRPDALSKTNTFYSADKYENTTNPFSEKEFETSPLNRILKQAAPGNDWARGSDHEIEFDYQANTGADAVKRFDVTLTFADNTYSPTINSTPDYVAGELYKNVTKDENHEATDGKLHTTEEFTDKQGRVVLKRTYALVDGNQEPHDTYYVYDDFGNLTYVLPPKMNGNPANMNELGYQYVYDFRNRLVEKRIPGKGKEYIVYNKLDQPIMTQDANQRLNNEWLFTKYDAFGRVAYTGKAIDPQDRPVVQGIVDALTIPLWVEQGTSNKNSEYSENLDIYYDNGAYPTSTLTEVLTINYYDNYVDRPTGVDQSISILDAPNGETNATNVKGLPTVSKVKVLNQQSPAKWIHSLTYYDDKARPIYSYSVNEFLNTVDISETSLDFIGKPLKTKTTHTRGTNTIVTIDNFQYDKVGRLLAQTQCIGDGTLGNSCGNGGTTTNIPVDLPLSGNVYDNQIASNSITVTNATLSPGTHLYISNSTGLEGDQELIVFNTFDNLGQLESKKVGGTAISDVSQSVGLQEVNYEYNVRGWLTDINDITDVNSDKLFNFTIDYNEGDKALYNGNISGVQWLTDNADSSLKSYNYSYDALNRITAATGGSNTNYDVTGITFDKNGNIQTLNRNGYQESSTFTNMDVLDYDYDNGNKLMKVADTGNDAHGFIDDAVNVADATDDYSYDQNGNMLTDTNKGITSITYNHLNLPEQVNFGSDNIKYVYDADGVKLKRTSSTGTETLYAGNFIYEGGVGISELQFFSHPEGYVTPDGQGGYDYVYNYVDHLGSVRLSYTDADNDGNIDPANEIIEDNGYYPFGLLMRSATSSVSPYGNSTAKRWKFKGNELDNTFNIDTYDFGARNYDPALGRWFGVDELAEDYYSTSPYGFVDNNPMINLEIDGRFWIRTVDDDGNVTYTAEDGDSAFSLFEQFGEQDGFNADEANFIIEHVFGENRVEDGEEFSNIDPEDSFTLLAEGSEIIEKENARDIRVVPNDSDAVETDLEEVDLGSIQKDQATLKAEDDRKALVITAQMTNPLKGSKGLKKALSGLKMSNFKNFKSTRSTNRSTYGNKIRSATTARSNASRMKIKAQEKIRRKKFKKRLKRNARKKKSGR